MAKEWVFADEPAEPSKAWVFADEEDIKTEDKPKAKSTWSEDFEAAFKGTGNVLESGRDALNLITARAREGLGMQPDTELGTGEDIAMSMQDRRARMQDPNYNPVVGKEQGWGALANVAPAVAAFSNPVTASMMLLGGGLEAGAGALDQGATQMQAIREGMTNVGVTGAMLGIAPAIPGISRAASNTIGAGLGAGMAYVEPTAINMVRSAHAPDMPRREMPTLPEVVSSAATGGVLSHVLHPGTKSVAPGLPDGRTITPPPKTGEALQASLDQAAKDVTYNKDLANQQMEKKAKALSYAESIPGRISKIESSINKLKKIPQTDEVKDGIAKLQAKIDKLNNDAKEIPGRVAYYDKEIEKLVTAAAVASRRVASITGEGHKVSLPDPPMPTEDPMVLRARQEEDAAARAEQNVEEQPSSMRRTELEREIESYERFLKTKQGTNEVRADIQRQLDALLIERDAPQQESAAVPEVPAHLNEMDEQLATIPEPVATPKVTQEQPPSAPQVEPTVTERPELTTRYEVNDHFHDLETKIKTWSTSIIESMLQNSINRFNKFFPEGMVRPKNENRAELYDMMLEEQNILDRELMQRDQTAITSPLAGTKFDLAHPDGTIKTATELVTEAFNNTKSYLMASLLKKLLDTKGILENITVVNDAAFLIEKGWGASFGQIGRIAKFRDVVDSLYVVHEMTHAAINDMVVRYVTGEGAPLSIAQRANIKTLFDYYNQVKGKSAKFSEEFQSAMKDPREFIAYLSDKRFMDQVVAITSKDFASRIWHTLTQLIGVTLGLSKKETLAFRQLQELQQTTGRLIETSEGFFTPKEMVDAYNKLIETEEATAITGQTQSIGHIYQERDPQLVLNDLQNQTAPVLNRLDLARDYLGNTSALAMAWKASPVVRQVYASMKRGEQKYEQGKRYIIDGVGNQQRMFMGTLRNLTDVADKTSYSVAMRNTSKQDKIAASDVLLLAHKQEVNPTTLAEFNSLSKGAKDLVIAFRAATKRAHEWMNNNEKSRGVKTLTAYKEGYIPHIRLGDYAANLSVKTPGGDYVPALTEYFHTAAQRDMWLEQVQASNPDLIIGDKANDIYIVSEKKAMEAAEEQRLLEEKIKAATMPNGVIDPVILDNLRMQAIQTRYYGGHHLFQSNTMGYLGNRALRSKEQNSTDLLNSVFNYADSLGKFERNKHIEEGTDLFLNHPDYRNSNHPDIDAGKILRDRILKANDPDVMKSTIDDMAASLVLAIKEKRGSKDIISGFPEKPLASRVNGVVTTIFTYGAMMGRLAFPISQAVTYLGQTPQYLAVQFNDSLVSQSRIMLETHRVAFDFSKGTEFDRMVEAAKTHHTFKPTMVNDFTQIRLELENVLANKILSTAANHVSGKRISELSDTFSRYMTFSSMYVKGKELGLSGNKLFEFMVDHTDAAAGMFSRHEKAPIIANTGIIGDAMSPITNYPIMQANWFINAMRTARKDGNYNPLLTMVVTNAAMGGIASTQFLAELEIVIMLMNMMPGVQITSPAKQLMLWAGDAREGLGNGAVGRVVETTLRQGAITGATHAAAETLGYKSGVDVGSGVRYQSPFKSVFDPNKSLADSFTGYMYLGTALGLFKDVASGKVTDEASIRKMLTSLRPLGLYQNVLTEYLMARFKINDKEFKSFGKDSSSSNESDDLDKLAFYIGSASTKERNAQTEYGYAAETKKRQMDKEGRIKQGVVDIETREQTNTVPRIMKDRFEFQDPKKQLKKYSEKDPESAVQAAALANQIGPAVEKNIVNRSRPKVVSDILEETNPYTIEKRIDIYRRMMGVDLTKNQEVAEHLKRLKELRDGR